MSTLNAIKLPPLCFYKGKKTCYVRTYHNKWVPSKKDPSKKHAVKENMKNVGTIASPDGIGVINFYQDFIDSHPELQLDKVIVSRNFNQGAAKPALTITPKAQEDHFVETAVQSSVCFGMHYVINKLLKNDPLLAAIQECFADTWSQILAIAEFMVCEPDAKMLNFAAFQSKYETYADDPISSSAITKLFKSITDKDIDNFFSRYIDKLERGAFYNKERFWALDSTSFGSYSKKLSDVKWGRPKQDEGLPQLNVMMLIDQETQRPIFYKHFNGSIPDVSTVKLMCSLAIELGARSFVIVFDRGYYGKDNLKEIYDTGYHFITCIPINKTIQFDDEIAEVMPLLTSGRSYDEQCGLSCTCLSKQYAVGQGQIKQLYVHVFYDHEEAGAQVANLLKRRAETAKQLKANGEPDEGSVSFVSKFFDKKADGTYEYNEAAFQKASNRAGFFVIASDTVKNTRVAFRAYKNRSTVEELFSSLKTRMKMSRLRVSTEASLDGKCFVQFVAASIWMMMDHVLDTKRTNGEEVPHNSLPHVINELKALSRITFKSGVSIYDVASKKQRRCLQMFGLSMPSDECKVAISLLPVANRRVAKKPHGFART